MAGDPGARPQPRPLDRAPRPGGRHHHHQDAPPALLPRPAQLSDGFELILKSLRVEALRLVHANAASKPSPSLATVAYPTTDESRSARIVVTRPSAPSRNQASTCSGRVISRLRNSR